MKVGVIFHRLGPYHVARLSAASEVCNITAIELAADTTEYSWSKVGGPFRFDRSTLFPEGDSRNARRGDLIQRLQAKMREHRLNVVAVPGWSDRAVFVAIRWCLRNGIPVVVMSESTGWDERRLWWKEWIKSRIVRLCSAALVGGSPQADYIERLGMPAESVFLGYDAVDNGYFAIKAEEIKKNAAESRKRYELPERYFLASARFIEKKNLLRLIQAYANYHSSLVTRRLLPWPLVLLGDGPLKSDLLSLIANLQLQQAVLLPGFKQYDELPVYYGLASAFIHASTTEPWGLVVNEAMASGLPVIVSDRCGCASDLVEEGCNGFTFDPCDVEQLAQLLLKVSAFDFPLSSFGVESQRIISRFDSAAFGWGLLQAAEAASQRPVLRPGLLDRALLKLLVLK
jgi:1,2-diacylglycerol 3-alpha-glucosyltransferase